MAEISVEKNSTIIFLTIHDDGAEASRAVIKDRHQDSVEARATPCAPATIVTLVLIW
jgi:hypothetical protein